MKQGHMKTKQGSITVDLSKIPNMKCYCGADVFMKVFNLKYISPIMCSDPKGGTATVFMYQCILCKQLWPIATTQDEVNKVFQKLPPDRKAWVITKKDELKAQKSALDLAEGGPDGPGK